MKAEEQALQYATNRGVPFLILTDGNLWDFYLSMVAGLPEERWFYQAELKREEKIPEHVEFLEKYLQKERVISNEAQRAAERRHESNRKRKESREAIPGAWQALLERPAEMLRDLLAEEVESQCGTKPDLDDVERFLRSLLSDDVSPTPSPVAPRPSQSLAPSPSGLSARPPAGKARSRLLGFVLDGKEVKVGDKTPSYQVLAEILKVFAHRDSEFMKRFEAKTVRQDNPKRRLVARNLEDLYVSTPALRQYSMDLENGWWMASNFSVRRMRKYIKNACEVAGVKFDSELKLIER